jgi:hypothetical protein
LRVKGRSEALLLEVLFGRTVLLQEVEDDMPQHRQAFRTFALTGFKGLRLLLLLAALTTLAMTWAYTVRPVVHIDIGDDRDGIFLQGFNGREIDAVGAVESFAWPAGQETLTVPGRREGVWIATLQLAPGKPDNALEDAAVAVNGIRTEMPQRTTTTVMIKLPPKLGSADSLTFSLVSPLVGGALPPKDLVSAVSLAPARTYRWSTQEATIELPNLGRGAWAVELAMVAAHPNGQPVNARIFADHRLLVALPDVPASSDPARRVHLLVPADAVRDGSLEVGISANTFEDPRPLGVLLSSVTVEPLSGGKVATALPPLGGLGLALTAVLGGFGALWVAGGMFEPNERRGRWLSPPAWMTLGVALAALLGIWALRAYRFPNSFMLPRLAMLSLWCVLLALVARPLTLWLFRAAGVGLDDKQDGSSQPKVLAALSGALSGRRFLNLLLMLFLVGYWLKAAGAIFPYFAAKDVHWHMTRAYWMVQDPLNKIPWLYGTSSPLNESTMPEAEWGPNPPIIPYSPWFHIFATSFALSPLGMDLTANMFSILLDGTRIVLVALIALKAGLSRRAGLIASATFAALPVGFLLHSWGNIPTGVGLWLTLVCNTIIFCFWERLHERRVMVTLSVLLLITFLEYTVTGVFMGVFLLIFTAILWLNGLRGGPWREQLRPLRSLWIASSVAITLALVIYYGQYIWPLIQQTVPYMGTVFTRGPESVGVERPPFGQYMWQFFPHLDYRIWPGDYLFFGLMIPLLFTIPGFIALRRQPLAWTILAAWGSVALLFMLAGYRISMVDKQLFYLLPLICVCWALYAERYWRRGRLGRLLVLILLLLTLTTALDQWIFRISVSPVP